MSETGRATGYVISRRASSDAYGLWRFTPNGRNLLTPVPLETGASFPRRDHLIWMGGYFLAWTPPQTFADKQLFYGYRMLSFDPGSKDPLAAAPLQSGYWPKSKFWGRTADFGNPGGGQKQYDLEKEVELIPLGTYLLNFIPTTGRGTYCLWNFDPCPTSPGTADPLPRWLTPQSSFRDMQLGDELLSFNNYVLDRVRATGEYRVFSFDPQNVIPLAHPVIQQGRWTTIDASHELVPIGEYVLDWVPSNRKYRLWRFDPTSADPLTGPVRTGTLPAGFAKDSTLVGFEPPVPIDTRRAAQPGTIDFMRTKIKHVVYYMLENRSFDHVCGWLYSQQEKGLRVIGPKGPYKGASTKMFNMQGKTKIPVSLYNNGKLSNQIPLEMFTFDPYHDNSDVLRQFFHTNEKGYAERATPNMGGFVWNNGSAQVMQGYSPEQLPILNGLARHFAISDEWFCSIPSSTDANRAFSLTGSSMMQLNNFMSPPQYMYWPEQPHRPPIFKLLWANGVTSWCIYNSTTWYNAVFTYQLFLEGHIPTVDASVAANANQYVAGIDQFYEDAQNGTLPAFSYLEPIWIGSTGTTSYHPGEDLVPGEVQLNKVYNALRKGPNWNETLLVITFDEHGGIFDHVPPPRTVNPWPNDQNDGFHFDLLGPRVPTILVSPWIDGKTVFRAEGGAPYDATSFLATLLHWFGVPRSRWFLGDRTDQAPTFEGVLTRKAPRKDAPALTPPYDKAYPQKGRPQPSTTVTDLQRHVAHQLLIGMTKGKLTPSETSALSEQVLRESKTIGDLHRRLEDVQKRFR